MFDFFETVNNLINRGEPFAIATVVRAEKPTSAKPGAKAIITPDGVLHGWIGGSVLLQPAEVSGSVDDQDSLVRGID